MSTNILHLPHFLGKELVTKGWVEVECLSNKLSLLKLAECLGKVIPGSSGELIDTVRPKTSTEAESKSFSFNFGLQRFPLHTDTAFWLVPARYVVMMCSRPSSTSTVVLGRDKVSRIARSTIAHDGIFSMRTIRGAIYGRALFDRNLCGLRYDPCYMKPMNRPAKELVHLFEQLDVSSAETERVAWNGNNAIIIDNWRCMHGREEVQEDDVARELWRVYVEDYK